jgi:diguanylate cyclase (GGDEF)-like protein
MTRRVTVVAAGVDAAFLVLFLLLDSPVLAWLNVGSIAMYGTAYWLLVRRINIPAVVLIWIEVLGHATIGSMLVGWNSGFHYYLLMFIPAIVISGRVREMVLTLALLLTSYLGLHAATQAYGSIAPLSPMGLNVVHAFNVTIVFAMASYTARFYYNTVRRAERKLLELATTDSLTRLANRRHLLALADREVERSHVTGKPITLILADIDHFKQINDAYGHDGGDRVITHASGQLASLCRAEDLVARWGGEEFLILLPATTFEDGLAMAERIRTSIASASVGHQGRTITYTLSFGVASLKENESFNDAMIRADRALYQSKEGGRDRVTAASAQALAVVPPTVLTVEAALCKRASASD